METTAAIDEALRLYGNETSDAWFAALADGTHPLCRIGAPSREKDSRPRVSEADLVTDPAMLEAAKRYAGDPTHDHEIEDLQSGLHPLLAR